MYRATVTKLFNRKETDGFDVVLSNEKMFEMIGRYTHKYGPPEIIDDNEDIFSLEFFHVFPNNDVVNIYLSYCKVAKDEPMFLPSSKEERTVAPIVIPPKKVYPPLEPRLAKLKEQGVAF